jgi:hypothetical protein
MIDLALGFLILALGPGVVLYGDDLAVPLDNGSIAIYAEFIRRAEDGSALPELALKIMNQTSTHCQTPQLEFEIQGSCLRRKHGAARESEQESLSHPEQVGCSPEEGVMDKRRGDSRRYTSAGYKTRRYRARHLRG